MHIPLLIVLSVSQLVRSQSGPSPRWGAASTLSHNTLIVHGGRTDPSGGASYDSASPTSDLFTLDFSQSFSLTSPPWLSLSDQLCDPVAFHSVSPFSDSQFLVFGGTPTQSSPHPAASDSAWILDIPFHSGTPSCSQGASILSSQPIRTELHSAASSNSAVWLIGGEKPDGSGLLGSVVKFSNSGFQLLPNLPNSPTIWGHSSVLFPNGTLLVLGGVFNNQLSSLSNIYVLDTSSPSPSWSAVSVSGTPSPRANFIAVLLDDNRIFIHGGRADTGHTPNVFLSDAWILDTSSLHWSSVDGISSMGEVSDHVAAAMGSLIFIAFGFGPSGVVKDGPRVFNISSGTFVQTWSPPISADPGTEATAPGTASLPFSTGEHTSLGTAVPSNTVAPRPTPSSNNNPKERSLAIALATVFGVLAVIGVTGAATYIAVKRREERNGGTFHLMKEEKMPEYGEDANQPITNPLRTVQLSNALQHKPPFAFLGGLFGYPARPQGRVDMLADEDVESFRAVPGDMGGRHRPAGPERNPSGWSFGSSISNWYGVGGSSSRRGWPDLLGQSVSSLKNVTAKFGRRDPARTSEILEKDIAWWDHESVPLDPFGDDMALRSRELDGAGPSTLAANNISGIAVVGVGVAARPRGGMQDSSGSYPYADPHADMSWPTEQMSENHSSTLRPMVQLEGDQDIHRHASIKGISHASHLESDRNNERGAFLYNAQEHIISPSKATSSVVGTNFASGVPIRRTVSWWSRFSRNTLLEKHLSPPISPRQATTNDALIEFRDPNPAPRLVPIKEISQSSPDSISTDHNRRKSQSSIGTIKTADSEEIERIAAMDVVQRMATDDSGTTASLNGSSVQVLPNSTTNVDETIVQSPMDTDIAPEDSLSSIGSGTTSNNTVASRVRLWERRFSHDNHQSTRPERRSYVLAPRASLYIANPDTRSKDLGSPN